MAIPVADEEDPLEEAVEAEAVAEEDIMLITATSIMALHSLKVMRRAMKDSRRVVMLLRSALVGPTGADSGEHSVVASVVVSEACIGVGLLVVV